MSLIENKHTDVIEKENLTFSVFKLVSDHKTYIHRYQVVFISSFEAKMRNECAQT